MSDQPDMFGQARPTDRLFFALFPPASVATHIAGLGEDLRRRHGLSGQLLATQRLHVTLHLIGDYAGLPADKVASARQAAERLRAAPFEAVFDRAESFQARGKSAPFVLQGGDGVRALGAFRQSLGVEMARSGLKPSPGFTPHVTLLYDRQVVAGQAVEPVRWTVDDVVLVHSLLGQSRYIEMGRWPLRA